MPYGHPSAFLFKRWSQVQSYYLSVQKLVPIQGQLGMGCIVFISMGKKKNRLPLSCETGTPRVQPVSMRSGAHMAEKTLKCFKLNLRLNVLDMCFRKTYSSIFLLCFSFILTLLSPPQKGTTNIHYTTYTTKQGFYPV